MVEKPEVVLDFQRTVLLRLCATEDASVTWVWLDRAFAPARWMALRRAIYDRARPSDDPLAAVGSPASGSFKEAQ